ncbi:MAG TPA: SDR family oxidoreductase [Nannocystaceae bacterium]|nr:SDR family oxidoreductase [Nannocystaceae bacterium]
MTTLKDKKALVLGASSGIGRATLEALASQGMQVCGVARDRERLERITREAPGRVTAQAGDATSAAFVEELIHAWDPDLVVLCTGVHPRLARIDEHTWESFSAPWHADVKATFVLGQAALRTPMRSGTRVVIVSSGAAIAGSPMSGGYAGSKRTQWFMSTYLQSVSDARGLGIRFNVVVPRQLVAGTEIAEDASRAYAQTTGQDQATYMKRFGTPLMADGVAAAILAIARGDEGTQHAALAVTGEGVAAL